MRNADAAFIRYLASYHGRLASVAGHFRNVD